MPLEVVTIPCRSDNYAFLLHDSDSGNTVLIDAPEAGPILAELEARGWAISVLLITHHHDDHVEAVETFRARDNCIVIGAKADAHRLPPLDSAVEEGDTIDFSGHKIEVMDVSGHTVGHLAFYVPDAQAAFTADSLMACGCGRLFEGTAEMMWASLSKLAALPPETLICSGHEYTAANAKFAATIEPDNPALISRIGDIETARAAGMPTVPSTLQLELDTNPFLRARLPQVKTAIGMQEASDAAAFGEIRRRKDAF
jgi:hydroxyacylglutathione hydrolase